MASLPEESVNDAADKSSNAILSELFGMLENGTASAQSDAESHSSGSEAGCSDSDNSDSKSVSGDESAGHVSDEEATEDSDDDAAIGDEGESDDNDVGDEELSDGDSDSKVSDSAKSTNSNLEEIEELVVPEKSDESNAEYPEVSDKEKASDKEEIIEFRTVTKVKKKKKKHKHKTRKSRSDKKAKDSNVDEDHTKVDGDKSHRKDKKKKRKNHRKEKKKKKKHKSDSKSTSKRDRSASVTIVREHKRVRHWKSPESESRVPKLSSRDKSPPAHYRLPRDSSDPHSEDRRHDHKRKHRSSERQWQDRSSRKHCRSSRGLHKSGERTSHRRSSHSAEVVVLDKSDDGECSVTTSSRPHKKSVKEVDTRRVTCAEGDRLIIQAGKLGNWSGGPDKHSLSPKTHSKAPDQGVNEISRIPAPPASPVEKQRTTVEKPKASHPKSKSVGGWQTVSIPIPETPKKVLEPATPNSTSTAEPDFGIGTADIPIPAAPAVTDSTKTSSGVAEKARAAEAGVEPSTEKNTLAESTAERPKTNDPAAMDGTATQPSAAGTKKPGAIVIQNLKHSAFEETLRHAEEEARKKQEERAQRLEDGELSSSDSDEDPSDPHVLGLESVSEDGLEGSGEVTDSGASAHTAADVAVKRKKTKHRSKSSDKKKHKKEKGTKKRNKDSKGQHRRHSTSHDRSHSGNRSRGAGKRRERSRSREMAAQQSSSARYNHHGSSSFYCGRSDSPDRGHHETSGRDRRGHRQEEERHGDRRGRRDRSRGRDRDEYHDHRDKDDGYSWRDRAERRRRLRDARSRSRSRSGSRRRDSDLREKIDKRQLLEIAQRRVAEAAEAAGQLPVGSAAASIAGRNVKELTEMCRQLRDSVNDPNKKAGAGVDPAFHHPFAVKERVQQIFMKIRNAQQLPTKSHAVRQLEIAKFPVSSGEVHRNNELEWVPVEKENDKKFETVDKKKAPGTTVSTVGSSENMAPSEGAGAPANNDKNPQSSTEPPQAAPAKPLSAVERARAEVDETLTMLRQESSQNNNDRLWPAEDWSATGRLHPGTFTGTTGARVLSADQLSSGQQAWARKNQMLETAPIQGGFGEALLKRMGWQPGEGLGKNRDGQLTPLLLEVKMDKKGLVSEEDKTKNKRQPAVTLHNVKDLSGKHPISAVMELCTKRRWGAPDFQLCMDQGPAHQKTFLYKVTVNSVTYQPSMASHNKKLAKASAAAACLQALGMLPREA